MARPVVEIDESNDVSGELVEHDVGELFAGSDDAFDLDPDVFRITPGDNSYEKWLRVHVTSLGSASAVGELRVWGEAPSDPECTLHYNGSLVEATYDGANHKRTSFATPATTSTRTPEDLPTSRPATANLGITGDLTDTLTAPGSSDYLLIQVRTTVDAEAGDTVVISFEYEVTP